MQLKKEERRYRLTTRSYARLAAWRHALRQFLRFSEKAAERLGLTGQHYQAMLVVRACPDSGRITIADLAKDLMIKHNSAVGLVDRLVEQGLVGRQPSKADRRKVEIVLSSRGRHVLAKLAGLHREELARMGPVLERLLAEIAHPER